MFGGKTRNYDLSMRKIPDLSVVVLGYRAEESIRVFMESLVAHLESAQIINFQIVLVANYLESGPKDTTPEIARELAQKDSRIRSVSEPKQGMMGWDARQGLIAAEGQVIALIDGDGQMPPEDIVRLYKVMVSGEFDFVKTYRVSREDGLLRLLSSRGFNLLFKTLFPNCRFRDINSKPKLISRRALSKMRLSCDGWFLDGEIILEVLRLRLAYAEIPTHFKSNEWRGSFVSPKTVFEMIGSMLKSRLGLKKKIR